MLPGLDLASTGDIEEKNDCKIDHRGPILERESGTFFRI